MLNMAGSPVPGLILAPPFDVIWRGKDVFALVNTLGGEEFRNVSGRRTFRTEINGAAYFIKIHQGVSWREVFKNLCVGKWPVIGARTELRAIERVHTLGVPTLSIKGFGMSGMTPSTSRSFLITEELAPTTDLEVLTLRWRVRPPSFSFKHALVEELARVIGNLHRGGVSHRDCYLCHFLLHTDLPKGQVKLSVIDLHRAHVRDRITARWIVKDLAALAFSAAHIRVSKRTYLRFLRSYFQCPLRELLTLHPLLLQAINRRMETFFRRKEKYGDLL
jgi:heptose I phosphotransferase